jgi:hypothetical protein
MIEFLQRTIGEIIDSEREMVLTARRRYGQYYYTALQCSILFSRLVKEITPDRWIFVNFLSLAKKHHTLALFSVVRLHKVQAMLNLRQTLGAGACAAFAIANPDHGHFVVADEQGILDPVPAKKRYDWLDHHYPAGSAAIKESKDPINKFEAHANLINIYGNLHTVDRAPFFDIEDEYHVKIDLWRVGQVALVLMGLFDEINEERNVIKFANDFWPSFKTLSESNNALRSEMMSSDRFKHAIAMEEVREAPKTNPEHASRPTSA